MNHPVLTDHDKTVKDNLGLLYEYAHFPVGISCDQFEHEVKYFSPGSKKPQQSMMPLCHCVDFDIKEVLSGNTAHWMCWYK